jgi:chemotaxis protein CheX
MVGRRNGTVTLHLSRRAVIHLANKFMEGDAEDINEEVFDAVGEITNIVAGRLKAELGTEEYGISNISCPSMIVGADYHMYHFRGFKSVSVEFELQGVPAILLADRLFSTTISLSQT